MLPPNSPDTKQTREVKEISKLHAHLDPVHTTPEKFENSDFILKTHQMFSFHTTPEKFENEHFGFLF